MFYYRWMLSIELEATISLTEQLDGREEEEDILVPGNSPQQNVLLRSAAYAVSTSNLEQRPDPMADNGSRTYEELHLRNFPVDLLHELNDEVYQLVLQHFLGVEVGNEERDIVALFEKDHVSQIQTRQAMLRFRHCNFRPHLISLSSPIKFPKNPQ